MAGESEAGTELIETPRSKEPPVMFDDLMGNLTTDIRKTGRQLAGLKGAEIDEKNRVFANMEGRMEGDRTIAKRHFDAAGLEVDKLQPWNAQQEYAKVSHSPLEAFGSFGSLFAIAASAFTRAPMTNALSASAAAMNAIHKGDEEAYARNFSGWKDNMALVKHRYDMQQGLYRDALDLMQHDMSAGRAKLQNVLERFGDEKKLLLLESGHDKELIDMFNSEVKAMEGMKKFGEEEMDRNIRRSVFDKLQAEKNPNNDPMQAVQNWDYAHGVSKPWQQNIINDFRINNQGAPDLERKTADFARGITSRSDFAQAYARFAEDTQQREGRGPTPEEDIKFHQEWQTRNPGGTGKTTEAERYINTRAPELMEATPGITRSEAERQARQEFTADKTSPKSRSTEAERYINENINAWQEANPDKSRRDGERALRQEYTADKSGGGKVLSLKERAINQIIDESRNAEGIPTLSLAQAEQKYRTEVTGGKAFTDTQIRQVRAAPVLMDHLRTLDYFAHVTGPIKGVPSEIAAVYGGLNDPAAVFEAAKRGARQAASDWGGTGRLKTQVETMLDTLPKTYQDARFNKIIAQQTMRDVSNEAQSFISLLEKSGKPLPESVLDKYLEAGIFPESVKKRDPRAQLKNDPPTVSDADLKAMRRYKGSLSLDEQKLLDQEVRRRFELWEKEHGRR